MVVPHPVQRRQQQRASGKGHPRHFRMKKVLARGCGCGLFVVPVMLQCFAHCLAHLTPLEESLFTANDCFPGGSTCDLVRVRLRLNQGDRNSSLPEHHHTVVEEEFPEQHNLVLLSNTSSNFPPRSQHADVSFRAFGRRFRLRLSADNFDASSSNFPARGSSDWNRTANGAALSGCFFSGHLVNRGGRSRTRITSASVNLCGKGVSGHFSDGKTTFAVAPSEGSKLRGLHKVYRTNPPQQGLSPRHRRPRRSPGSPPPPSPNWPPKSKDNWLEIMVVADGPMVKYHGSKLKQYVLTLMNIVSLIYKHKSLGNSLQMSVVKLMILNETDTFSTSNAASTEASSIEEAHRISASETLKKFCKWQRRLMSTKPTYDVALLLTRENICRNPSSSSQNCDTLGLAELGTMCDAHSCAIVQDNGLSAAFTIAHELGHVLNMPHDDDQKCIDFASSSSWNSSSVSYVMSRMLDHNTNPWEWSECSRHYVTKFLDANYGHCLQNKPPWNLLDESSTTTTASDDVPKYPGEYFDENKQCEFVFGHHSKICSYMPPCARLWCTTSEGEENGCRTQHMPWADGTACGPGKWCIKSQCVPREKHSEKKPIHGQWGEWQSWSSCSRSCDGGIRRSVRECDNPSPSRGGLYCTGDRVRYESCNIWDCQEDAEDFRQEQCAVFDGNNFDIDGVPTSVKWVPKYTSIQGTDQCKLFCRVHRSSAYYLLASSVIDGTECGAGTFHKCVNGQCVPAGCDHVLGSGKALDWCGVCGGDNSTCVETRGFYNVSRYYGYNYVARIPKGAANLDIRQYGFGRNSNDDTYIALRDVETGEYLLNGDFVMSMFGKTILYGGTQLQYSGSDAVVERVNASRPLRKDLLVEVLTVGNLYPPQVDFSYAVSNQTRANVALYKWKTRKTPKWSHCDNQCQGKQFGSTAMCVDSSNDTEVDERHCAHLKDKEPKVLVKDCNLHCTLAWRRISGGETPCSARCGPGKQTLTFGCTGVFFGAMVVAGPSGAPGAAAMTLPDQYCREHLKQEKPPPEEVDCEGPCQGVKWKYGHWSKCSQSCGGGVQVRTALCVDSNSDKLLPDEDCFALSPVTKRQCQEQDCPSWKTGEWTACNTTCGVGVRQRPYWCQVSDKKIDGRYCSGEMVPRHIDECTEKPCTVWFKSNWTGCSKDCRLLREVFCQEVVSGNKVDDTECDALTKPPSYGLPCSNKCDNDEKKKKVMVTSLWGVARRPYHHWRVGPWHKCSTQCGEGTQRRAVACFDSEDRKAPSRLCLVNVVRPRSVRNCTESTCTKWLKGPWSECSTTCGKGLQTRWVSCVNSTSGQEVIRSLCISASKEPASEQICGVENDSTDALLSCRHAALPHQSSQAHHLHGEDQDSAGVGGGGFWRTGEWAACSQTCGGGLKRRVVVCQSGRNTSNCDPDKRPPEEISCNTEPCPTWNFGEWGQCDKTCGGGIQQRLVRCQDHLGQTLPDLKCQFSGRPHNSRKCGTQPCKEERRPKYMWKTFPWTACSKSCDRGISSRRVDCVDISNGARVVDDAFCHSAYYKVIKRRRSVTRIRRKLRRRRRLRKPRINKVCNKSPCPFKWMAGPWSECTHTCGKGVQYRHVTCHDVNAFGWLDPEPISRGCNATAKPADFRECPGIADCNSKYMWVVGQWGRCSFEGRECGQRGRQRRKIHCVNASGKKVRKRQCKNFLRKKPKRSRKCAKMICGYESCLDVKTKTGASSDGEYDLFLAGRNVSVFCHRMDSALPKEYITMPSGEEQNYSEIYGLRLLNPESCPRNGTRDDDCHCVRDARRREGLTLFSKIRVNVTSLKVNTHDFTFARQVRGQIVAFGEAGDCYSTANCPQGSFGINLVGTGLRVSPYTGWVGQGNRPSLWLKRESRNQVIHGKCGGYCGTCVPEPHHGLKLDLLPPPAR